MSRTAAAMKALLSSELEWVPETDCKDRLARLLVEPTFVALAWVFWRQRASITLPNDADRSGPVPVSAESMVTVS